MDATDRKDLSSCNHMLCLPVAQPQPVTAGVGKGSHSKLCMCILLLVFLNQASIPNTYFWPFTCLCSWCG